MQYEAIDLDKDGFLLELASWTPELAHQIAAKEDIALGDDHWEIIYLVRAFYEEFGISPINRILVKTVATKLGKEKGNSIYLMKLFPSSPAKLACKIAGLPKPNNCL